MLEARYFSPFLESTAHVFQTMLQLVVRPGVPRLRHNSDAGDDASAIIGLSGDVTGAVTLRFPMETASRLVSQFIGEDVAPDHPDFPDALGELANMVAGSAKAQLTGKTVSISCPSIVMGAAHHVYQRRDIPTVEIPFSTDVGSFIVDVCMLDTAGQAASQPLPAAG